MSGVPSVHHHPGALTVERVGPETAGAVLAVVRAAFGGRPPLDPPADALAETEESLRRLLGRGGGLLARLDGAPAGALVLDPGPPRPGGPTVSLRRFGVAPAAQGHGVAAALVAAATDAAAEQGATRLSVLAREELPATAEFWERQGFAVTERRPPYVELSRPLPRDHDAPTAEDMRALGARTARLLRSGDLVLLTGDLGAGKTMFAQGVGKGLGVRGEVTSPTFVIARVHPSLRGGPDLVHVDAHRLGGLAELDDLDLDASLDDAVTVVEWGEGLAEGLADSRLEVRIHRLPDAATELDRRRVTLVGVGPRWARCGVAV